MKKYLLILTGILSFTASCSQFEKHTVVLWTNRPEIAAYVEEFNAIHSKTKVEIEYRENPGESLKTAAVSPDIVFDEYLNAAATFPLFTPLDSLFKKEKIDKTLFYHDLLTEGSLDGHQVLLPVSFNLPLIFFKKNSDSSFIVPFFMNLDTLRNASQAANKKNKKNHTVEGFSPLWDTEMLFQITRLYNTDFKQTHSFITWNNENLVKSTQFIQNWILSVNGGLIQEREFREKYLYDPKPNLIEEGRISFAYANLTSFFALPPEKRKNLDFRWLSHNNQVHVLQNVLYTGIPKSAVNKRDAEIFLSWFFKRETQKKFLEATIHKRIRIFGIGQGFSSLREINNNELPKLHPALMGHIPPEAALLFPPAVPENWVTIKEHIIKPWLYQQVSTDSPPPDTLKDTMVKWEKQNPDQKALLD